MSAQPGQAGSRQNSVATLIGFKGPQVFRLAFEEAVLHLDAIFGYFTCICAGVLAITSTTPGVYNSPSCCMHMLHRLAAKRDFAS